VLVKCWRWLVLVFVLDFDGLWVFVTYRVLLSVFVFALCVGLAFTCGGIRCFCYSPFVLNLIF
jgi:hypothetical protein